MTVMVGACPKFQQTNLVDRVRFSLKQQEGGMEGGTKGGKEGRGREGKRKEGLTVLDQKSQYC